MSGIDRDFAGSIPEVYERYLVPLIFEDYAADLARRARALAPRRVLEVAAGTGVVTRRVAAELPEETEIVATDLNQDMLDHAASIGTKRPVEWRRADALNLAFEDETFDLVLCGFGVMFFPDRPNAFSEARRVLRLGGTFVFNVWDRVEENEFADEVTKAVAALFPDNPPQFLPRTPYGYYDIGVIAADLAAGGFTAKPGFETVAFRSRADSPRDAAVAFCEGTPLRNEIEAIDASRVEEAVAAATETVARRFGSGPVDAKIQAIIVTVAK